MPLYDFKCEHCDKEHELFVKLDAKDPECPSCGRSMVRLTSATTFILNGTGWAKDNYGLKAKKKGDKK